MVKPFGFAEVRPFDVAQGKPFDVAQGKQVGHATITTGSRGFLILSLSVVWVADYHFM
jgi:hypothetical protein